jgi:hypothetical protein
MSGAIFSGSIESSVYTLRIIPFEVNVAVCASMSRFKRAYRAFLGNSSATCTRTPQGEVPAGRTALPKNITCMFSGTVPRRQILPTPPPTGVTH